MVVPYVSDGLAGKNWGRSPALDSAAVASLADRRLVQIRSYVNIPPKQPDEDIDDPGAMPMSTPLKRAETVSNPRYLRREINRNKRHVGGLIAYLVATAHIA